MLTAAIVLFVLAAAIGLGSFILAAKNMSNMMGGDAFDQGFKRHAKLMIPMAIAAVCGFAGVVCFILYLVERFAG
jgi:TRAP-type C4-dicarboxylate transport system permease small subunit